MLLHLARHMLVDDQRLARAHNVDGKSSVAERFRFDAEPLPVFVQIGEVQQPGLWVIDADADVGLMENLADLVANGVVDALHVELGRKRLLHAVDDGQFRRALLALLEQALCFVEKSGVLECYAHGVGKGLQQAHVGRAEGVLAILRRPG